MNTHPADPVSSTIPSSKEQMRRIQHGRNDTWKLKRLDVVIDPDFNTRTDFGDLEGLAQSIAEHGIRTELRGRITQDGKFHIDDGERRLRAYDLAVELGLLDSASEKALIPVKTQPQNYTEAQRVGDILVFNGGKPLTPYEQAITFQRLIHDHGQSREAVSKSYGYSITHIDNCLRLLEAPAAIQQAVQSGEMAATTANDLIVAVPDPAKQVEALEAGRADATARGSTRITARDLPVETGKKRQATERAKAEASDTAATDHEGNFISGVKIFPCSFGKLKAEVKTVQREAGFYVGWYANYPGAYRGASGPENIKPSLHGVQKPSYDAAILCGLQFIRTAIEGEDFSGAPADADSAREFLDEEIGRFAKLVDPTERVRSITEETPEDGEDEDLANPVLRDPAEEAEGVLKAVDKKQCDKARHEALAFFVKFLNGKKDTKDLTKFVLGII